jgi:hypothetical protein
MPAGTAGLAGRTPAGVRAVRGGDMGWTPTLGLLAASAALLVLAEIRARREPDPLRPALVPWRAVVLVAGAAAFVLLVHVVALLGGGPAR